MSPERDATPSVALPDALGRPPFLTWNALYTLVLCALVVEIVAFAAMTVIYR